VYSNLNWNSNLNQIENRVKKIEKTSIPFVGHQPHFQPAPAFSPDAAHQQTANPPATSPACLGRCQAGHPRQVATSQLSSSSLFPFSPVFSLVSRRRRGKASYAAVPVAAGCLHASRARSSRPLYLPPAIRAGVGASP
jgi:hypothetical protein